MNLDHLKRAWAASIATAPADTTLDALLLQAQARARSYRRDVLKRTVFGATAFCLALGLLAALWLLPGPSDLGLGMRIAMLLWGAGLVACVAGLWPLRSSRLDASELPLQSHLQACMVHVRREIAYHRSVRWRFWLPFGAGLASALSGHMSPRPDVTWLLAFAGLLACAWGFVRAPRLWPERLRAEEATLQEMLGAMQAATGEGERA